FLFRFGVERIPLKVTRWFGPSGAGMAMIIYFGHCLLRDRGEFEEAVFALVRSLLVYQVVWGLFTAMEGAVLAIIERCKPVKRLLHIFATQIQTHVST